MQDARVTLREVATWAGLHVATAWRALENDAYVEVSKSVRLLVEGCWIEGEVTRWIGPAAQDLIERIG